MMVAVKEYGQAIFTLKVGMQAGYGGSFMENWGNRYTHGRGGRAADHSRAERVKNVIIILLAVALVGIGIVGFQAIAFKGDARDLVVARAMTECNNAVSIANSLSRSGGSDTAGMLGKIRANVNAVDVLSGVHQSLFGRELAPRASFTGLYNIIDSYSAKLRNGTATIEELTNLADGLTALQLIISDAK